MTEHSELVAEINVVEKMAVAERLKHARKRRITQLKKWTHYEKQIDKEFKKRKQHPADDGSGKRRSKRRKDYNVHFVHSVMLLEAAARNDVDEVALLLKNNVTPDVTNEDGLTALHQCCIDDSEEMLELLLEYGANVNAQDSELWTPLHAAATCGHRHLCKLLILKGGELLSVNADGNMPYDICEDELTLDFIESEMAVRGITQEQIDETRLSTETQMLQDLTEYANHHKDLSFKDRQGATPLHIAAANGYTDVVEFLLSYQVAVDAQDDETWQPIHAAACWGHPLILELLVQNGAELEAKTKNGETPFDLCEDPEMKQKILDMKDEIDASKSSRSKGQHRSKRTNTRSFTNSTSSLYNSNSSLPDKYATSASIRRSSMREKNLLFMKEAKEEAAHFGVRISDEINGEATVDDKDSDVPATDIDDIPLFFPKGEFSDKELDITKRKDTLEKRKKDVIKEPTHKPFHPEIVIHDSEKSQDSACPTVPTTVVQPSPERKPAPKAPESTTIVTEPAEPDRQVVPDPPTHSADNINSIETASRSSTMERNERGGMRPEVRYPSGAPQGTLSDLKKQRAEKHASLRLQDGSNSLNEKLQSMFLATVNSDHPYNYNASLNKPETSRQNGHNGQNNSVLPGEQPLRRFKDHGNMPVAGNDEKRQCCVLL